MGTDLDVAIEQAGHAWVQDLGRPGHCRTGISANGASDAHAATVANALVGNALSAPLIETTGSGITFTVESPCLLAVTGAADHVWVDGTPQPVGEALSIEAASRVHLDAPARGWRSYVAFNGRLAAAEVLGSVSPDPLLGVGRFLHPGDRLHVRTAFAGFDQPHLRLPLFRLGSGRPRWRLPLRVDVTPGPDAREFVPDDLDSLAFQVSPRSDYVGLRLSGETPRRTVSTEILSRGVPVGAVEVPPTGGLLVLLRGRLVTAGYPVMAVATATSIDRLGQARPGDGIVFRACTVDEAVAELGQRRDDLAALCARVGSAFGAVGLGDIIDPKHPSRPGAGQMSPTAG